MKRFKSWRVFYIHVEVGKAQLCLEASRCKTDIRRAKISRMQHASIFQDSSQFQIILYCMSSLVQLLCIMHILDTFAETIYVNEDTKYFVCIRFFVS